MGYLLGLALIAAVIGSFMHSMRRRPSARYYPIPFDDVFGYDPEDGIYWDGPAYPPSNSGYYPSGPYRPQPSIPSAGYWQPPYPGGAYHQTPVSMPIPHGPVYSPDYRYVLNPYTGQWMEQ